MSRFRIYRSALLCLAGSIAPLIVALPETPAADKSSAVVALVKLLDSGRLPPERTGAVVEMICSRGRADDLATMLRRTIDGQFDPQLQVRVLELLTDAAQVRKVTPSGDLTSVIGLIGAEGSDAAVRRAAIKLAATWQVPQIASSLRSLATDDRSSAAMRNIAVDGLASLGDADARATLVAIAASDKSVGLRMHASAALAKLDLNSAATTAAAALTAAKSEDDVGPMVDAFLNRKGGSEQWAAALTKVDLPADAAKLALRHMYSVGRSDAALSDVLSKAAGIALDQKPPTPEELRRLLADVAAHGDASRGEKVFRRSDLSCLKCHALARAGGQVGPELTAVGSISPVDYIANSILVPNLAVKEQFVTRVFVTDDGQTVTGIVIDRDAQRVNVRDASGKVVTIPTADIDEEEEGKSLMPQGLTKFLTRDELIDLIKFVSELGRPGPYAIRSTPTIQRWRVLRNVSPQASVEHLSTEWLRKLVLDRPAEEWTTVYATAAGDLPLNEVSDTGRLVVVQGELQVVEPGEIELQINSTSTPSVWYDADVLPSDSARKITLSPGVHRLTFALVVPDQPEPTFKVAVVKPAGSKAQFDVVGGQ